MSQCVCVCVRKGFALSLQGLPKAPPAGHSRRMDTGKRKEGVYPDGQIWERGVPRRISGWNAIKTGLWHRTLKPLCYSPITRLYDQITHMSSVIPALQQLYFSSACLQDVGSPE